MILQKAAKADKIAFSGASQIKRKIVNVTTLLQIA